MELVKIHSEVREFITNNFLYGNDSGLTDVDSLVDGGVIDSTGVLELVGFLQERFGLDIKDNEIVPSNLDSINNLVSFISTKLRSES
jgi:acyl carrier protein